MKVGEYVCVFVCVCVCLDGCVCGGVRCEVCACVCMRAYIHTCLSDTYVLLTTVII